MGDECDPESWDLEGRDALLQPGGRGLADDPRTEIDEIRLVVHDDGGGRTRPIGLGPRGAGSEEDDLGAVLSRLGAGA